MIKRDDKTVNNVLLFISSTFKGLSQVLLIENPITGFFIFIALMVASVKLGIITLLSAIIGTGIAKAGGGNRSDIAQGLFGFNSVLTGLAIFLYSDNGNGWIIALIAAAVAVLVNAAAMHLQNKLDMPALTLPFVISTWVALFAAYQIGFLKLDDGKVPQSLTEQGKLVNDTPQFFEGVVKSIGQVFLQDQLLVAVLILAGIFWASWKSGVCALAGSAIACISAYILGVDMHSLSIGLYGYNAVLTILAISPISDANNRFNPITSIFAAILTVLVTAFISTLLVPYGVPALTMPFVLTAWLFHGAKKILPNI